MGVNVAEGWLLQISSGRAMLLLPGVCLLLLSVLACLLGCLPACLRVFFSVVLYVFFVRRFGIVQRAKKSWVGWWVGGCFFGGTLGHQILLSGKRGAARCGRNCSTGAATAKTRNTKHHGGRRMTRDGRRRLTRPPRYQTWAVVAFCKGGLTYACLSS